MAKKNKKKKAKGNAAKQMRRLFYYSQQFFLRRYLMIEIVMVFVGALIAVAIIVSLLFGGAPSGNSISKPRAELQTDIIDELELFVELRNTAYENPPIVRPDIFIQ